MRQATLNSFNEGLLSDLNPLTTPQTCLSDCLNGTLITYNGNEFTLQSDNGNVRIPNSNIPTGFIPVGNKSYGGILYLALLNPENGQCQIGSIPSPDYLQDSVHGEQQPPIISSSDGIEQFVKLFEREQLEINPGDKYQIRYQMIKGSDFIANGKSIYNIKWWAIDSDGNKYELTDANVIKFTDDNNLRYFNQTIRATLGVEVTIDNINFFDAFVVETTDRNALVKFRSVNKIKDLTTTADDIFIKGCKVEYINPVSGLKVVKYYKMPANTDVNIEGSFVIQDNFRENDEVEFTVTPISNYQILTELSQNLNLSFTTNVTIDKTNKYFQYRYSKLNKSLRLQFDYRFDPTEKHYLYLEFYDVWSDYSVIVPVEDPNPFNKNVVFIDTSNEELTENFAGTFRGGISTDLLNRVNHANDTANKILYRANLGSRQYVRHSQILRENNLYVVAITDVKEHVESVNGNDVITYTHTSINKAFILNENMNSKFDNLIQNNQNTSLNDFTQLKNKDVNIELEAGLDGEPEESFVTYTEEDKLQLKSDKGYYILKPTTPQSFNNQQTYTLNYEKTEEFKVKFNTQASLETIRDKYGIIKLQEGASSVIHDQSQIDDRSRGQSSSTISYANKKISRTMKTGRVISADINSRQRSIFSHDPSKDVTIWSTMLLHDDQPEDQPFCYMRRHSTPNPYEKRPNSVYTVTTKARPEAWITEANNLKPDDAVNDATLDQVLSVSKYAKSNLSGMTLGWFPDPEFIGNVKTRWRDRSTGTGDYMQTVVKNPDRLKFMFWLKSDKEDNSTQAGTIAFWDDKTHAINMLQSIFVPTSVTQTNYYLYTYQSIIDDGTLTTSYSDKLTLQLNNTVQHLQYAWNGSAFTNILNGVNVANYASTISNYLKTNFNVKDATVSYFELFSLNSNTLSLTKSVTLPTNEITEGTDSFTLFKLQNSLSDLETYEQDKLTESKLVQGGIYSKDPSWNKFISKFGWISSEKRFYLKREGRVNMRTWWQEKDRNFLDRNRFEGPDFIENYFIDGTI